MSELLLYVVWFLACIGCCVFLLLMRKNAAANPLLSFGCGFCGFVSAMVFYGLVWTVVSCSFLWYCLGLDFLWFAAAFSQLRSPIVVNVFVSFMKFL